jgi:hypothetical protein
MPGCLTITTTEGNTNITRKEPFDASKTLGVFIAPDSNRKAQMEYMQNKAKDFASEMRIKGPKTKNDHWIDLVHTIRKTMDYPMAATQLKEREWDDIMSTLHKAALPRCGLVRTFPHAVLYGPKKFQGSGQEHPYFKQEILHIYELVKEINRKTQQGIQYRITVEQLKIEQGYPGNWTDAPYPLLSSGTTYSLIQTIWKFCYSWSISIQDNFGSIPLSRVDDEFLMPSFVMARYGKSDLKTLNECRLYLHAITLADISTIKGDTLTEQAYNGKRADQHLHNLEWPRQPHTLSKSHWDLWKKALTKCFLWHDSDQNTRRLQHPLGNWLVDPTRYWKWYYHASSNKLFTKSQEFWRCYHTTSVGRTQKTAVFLPIETVHNLPENSEIACVSVRRAGGVIMGTYNTHSYYLPALTTGPKPSTITQAITNLSKGDKWAVEELFHSDEGASIANLLSSNQIIAVCDGSYDSGTSTSSFILTHRDKNLATTIAEIKGSNCIPGSKEDQNSYRAELGGIMGIIVSLKMICEIHNIANGQVEIGLDGKEAMTAVFSEYHSNPDDSCYDLIQDIRSKITLLPITIIGRHVEGHQDDPSKKGYKPFKKIDGWGQLNIKMDKMAKRFMKKKKRHQLSKHSVWRRASGRQVSRQEIIGNQTKNTLQRNIWKEDTRFLGETTLNSTRPCEEY